MLLETLLKCTKYHYIKVKFRKIYLKLKYSNANSGGECSLRAFITDYVRSGESERLAAAARSAIDEVMRSPSAWRERGPPPVNPNVKSG